MNISLEHTHLDLFSPLPPVLSRHYLCVCCSPTHSFSNLCSISQKPGILNRSDENITQYNNNRCEYNKKRSMKEKFLIVRVIKGKDLTRAHVMREGVYITRNADTMLLRR